MSDSHSRDTDLSSKLLPNNCEISSVKTTSHSLEEDTNSLDPNHSSSEDNLVKKTPSETCHCDFELKTFKLLGESSSNNTLVKESTSKALSSGKESSRTDVCTHSHDSQSSAVNRELHQLILSSCKAEADTTTPEKARNETTMEVNTQRDTSVNNRTAINNNVKSQSESNERNSDLLEDMRNEDSFCENKSPAECHSNDDVKQDISDQGDIVDQESEMKANHETIKNHERDSDDQQELVYERSNSSTVQTLKCKDNDMSESHPSKDSIPSDTNHVHSNTSNSATGDLKNNEETVTKAVADSFYSDHMYANGCQESDASSTSDNHSRKRPNTPPPQQQLSNDGASLNLCKSESTREESATKTEVGVAMDTEGGEENLSDKENQTGKNWFYRFVKSL